LIDTNGAIRPGTYAGDDTSVYNCLGQIPGLMITPAWNGYDTVNGGIFAQQGGNAPDRYLIVEWKGVTPVSRDAAQMQAILYESGLIEFRYAPSMVASALQAAAAIGVQTATTVNAYYCPVAFPAAVQRVSATAPTPGSSLRFAEATA